MKTKEQTIKRRKERENRRGVLSRFTDAEMTAMRESVGVEQGELPDASVVGMFVRRNLRNGRRCGK